jgi:Family of unknown function (DUF5681)
MATTDKGKKYKYDVGYGKPPTSKQFRKGTSGNPKGRPRGSKSLSTIVKETLDEKVVVRENGRRGKITMLAAMIKQQANKAVSGDQRAVRYLIELNLRLNSEDVRQPDGLELLRQAFERDQARKAQMAADCSDPLQVKRVGNRASESNLPWPKKAVFKPLGWARLRSLGVDDYQTAYSGLAESSGIAITAVERQLKMTFVEACPSKSPSEMTGKGLSFLKHIMISRRETDSRTPIGSERWRFKFSLLLPENSLIRQKNSLFGD